MDAAFTCSTLVPVNKLCAAQKLVIYRDAARLGEWLEPEVRSLYAKGLLFATDYCWHDETKRWVPLDQFVAPRPQRRLSVFRQR